MTRREELEKEIENFELDPDDYKDNYKEMLNEEGPVKVCGLTFDPAYIVEELDPTAYRCGLIDYVDAIDKDDDPKYRALVDELEELEEEEETE